MLSFIKENGPEQCSSQQYAASLPDAQDNTQAEYLTVSGNKQKVRKSTTVLAAFFLVGLVCLGFMIKKTSPKAADAKPISEDIQIETAIERLVGAKSAMFGKLDEVIKKFYEFSNVQQVEVEQLSKNPFKHELFAGNLKDTANPDQSVEGDGTEFKKEQLRQQMQGLQLLSIMKSENGNCCMIDDKILREGDSIRSFKISKISDKAVTITSPEGVEATLKLSE